MTLYFNSAVPAGFVEDTRVLWTPKPSRFAPYRGLYLCDMLNKESLGNFTAGVCLTAMPPLVLKL